MDKTLIGGQRQRAVASAATGAVETEMDSKGGLRDQLDVT